MNDVTVETTVEIIVADTVGTEATAPSNQEESMRNATTLDQRVIDQISKIVDDAKKVERETPGELFVRVALLLDEKMLKSAKLPEVFRATGFTDLAQIKIDLISGTIDERTAATRVCQLRQRVLDKFAEVEYETYLARTAREMAEEAIKEANAALALEALEVVYLLPRADHVKMASTLQAMGIDFTVGLTGQINLITEEDLAALRPLNNVTYKEVNGFLTSVVRRGTLAEKLVNAPERTSGVDRRREQLGRKQERSQQAISKRGNKTTY